MDSGLFFLFVGFAAVWLVLGGYVLYLNRRIRELGEEIERLSGKSRSEDESA